MPFEHTLFKSVSNESLSTMHSTSYRSEEHTSELQSQSNIVCRLLLEKKKLFGLHHAAGNSAKRSRESRLVHGLHALSSRARVEASRSAAQFSDDDCRSYQARHCERVDARRSDLCGGSDDTLPRRGSGSKNVLGRRQLSSGDDRSCPNARQAPRN